MDGMEKQPIVGRFAPSPSGRMHLGNLFCALVAWLSVRSEGGRMVLRIEDLDTARCPLPYAQQLERDLAWFGMDWDEGGEGGGPHAPYFQSHRTKLYEEAFSRLSRKARVYPCFCTRAELHAASAPHPSDGLSPYGGRCRKLTPEQVAALSEKRRPAWRIQVPNTWVELIDGHCGPYKARLDQDCGDFILRRSDGVYAYQLAVCVDDGAMGVTQVVRGRDLLPYTPQQIWLLQQLGYPVPQYFHIPLLTAPDGRRLSKRDGDLDVGSLQKRYGCPQPILGLLAHWCGLLDRPEPVSAQELIPLFSWEKLPQRDIPLPAEFVRT